MSVDDIENGGDANEAFEDFGRGASSDSIGTSSSSTCSTCSAC
ncbi:hypothetical protein [Streptomyces cinereoruber]